MEIGDSFWKSGIDSSVLLASYSPRFTYQALKNEETTLHNAATTSGIKERYRRPIVKRMAVIGKEIEGYEKKLMKGKLSETETKKIREEINARTKELETLQLKAKEAGKHDPQVKRLFNANNKLNVGNHALTSSLSSINPAGARFVETYIPERDKLSADLESSVSAATSVSAEDYLRTFRGSFRYF